MKSRFKGIVVPILATIAFMALYYYLALPALNLRAGGMWIWFILGAAVYATVYFSLNDRDVLKKIPEYFGVDLKKIADSGKNKKAANDYYVPKKPLPKKAKVILIVVASVLALLIIASAVTSTRLFRAADYQKMLTVTESDFSKDIAELPMDQVPVVDRDTAERLGARKIGEVVELVSQFDVSTYYSQINYNGKPYRVSPLQYAGFLKWLSNSSEGIPYYVTIDMATQNTELVELEVGMKYSPSEYFSRDLNRHIRMAYPTKMFENLSFEIKDDGTPFWVMSYYDYTIGLFGGKDIAGVILVDAVTGEMTDYPVSEIPQWIDLAYSPELIVSQADNWGSLKNGFFNSIFVQKNVVVTTEGYNYIAVDDDVWLYTGITSVSADESNIGFILINMRTKEAKTYMINGAEEYSAMESAEGQIQEKGYVATFPILLNIADRPTYFISLKDNAGLVKAYAFVSVANYQTVGVADNIADAANEYRRMLGLGAVDPDEDDTDLTEYNDLAVDEVAVAMVDGNSIYYIIIDGKLYTADISLSDMLPFLRMDDRISFVANGDGKIKEIKKINRVSR
ncbi:MAG: CvpA family protein [Clostridia bacterium]|nr:CvpA family protein [Clostridia bacterium]